jgi:hypothetical protein
MLLPAETIKQLVSALALQIHRGENTRSTTELDGLVTTQLSKAPHYIYLGFAVLTRLFNLTPILKWGKTFSASAPDQQNAHILSWKRSPIKLLRDFINFYEGFVVLGIYENYRAIDHNDGSQA